MAPKPYVHLKPISYGGEHERGGTERIVGGFLECIAVVDLK